MANNTKNPAMMNVYELRLEFGTAWVCAYTVLQAFKLYFDQLVDSITEINENNDIVVVHPHKWTEISIKVITNDKKHFISLDEFMANQKEPAIISNVIDNNEEEE